MGVKWKVTAVAMCWLGGLASQVAAKPPICENIPLSLGEQAVCDYRVSNDNSNPDGFSWVDSVELNAEQDSVLCPEHLCNVFSVRVSDRNPEWKPWDEDCDTGPIVLFVPGGFSNYYPSDDKLGGEDCVASACEGPPEGIRLLQKQLHEAGARILEIRYKCPMLNPDVTFYQNTHACQHSLLNTVLNLLVDLPIVEKLTASGPASAPETWWPAQPACRFALGISEGQTQLQFAIDVLNDDVGVMNRVVQGGGGLPYDIRGTVDCFDSGDDLLRGCATARNGGCPYLEFTNFLFGDLASDIVDACGGCWDGCKDGHQRCSTPVWRSCSQTPIETVLDDASISKYIGPGGDDSKRILGGVIVNTGFDGGVNQETNEQYLTRRDSVADVPDSTTADATKERLWEWRDCLCGCPFWGHGTVNRTYVMFEGQDLPDGRTPIDDWTEFFVEGNLDFDLYDTNGPKDPAFCPTGEELRTRCAMVAPPIEVAAPKCR